MAYADEITLLCITVPGLQMLIDVCAGYARKWRFNFDLKKTKCMSISSNLVREPKRLLNGEGIDNESCIEVF